MNIFELYGTIGLDDSGFSNAIIKASNVANKFGDFVADAVDKVSDLTAPFGAAGQSSEELSESLTELENKLSENEQKIIDLTDAFNESAASKGVDAEETRVLSDVLEQAKTENEKLGESIGSVREEIERQKDSVSNTGISWNDFIGTLKGYEAVAGTVLSVTTNIIKGFANIVTSASKTGDRVDKMSQKLGISRKVFQEWDYILGQNGASIDSLGRGMITMQTKMEDAVSGNQKATKAFDNLGISMDDVKSSTPEEMFKLVIKRLQELEPESNKATRAVELFGLQGKELMPLLNQTAEATDELRARAHDLGLVMTDEAVDASVTFGDLLDDLKLQVGAVATRLGTELLPKISNAIEKIIDSLIILSPLINGVIGFIANNITAIAAFGFALAGVSAAIKGMLFIDTVVELFKKWEIVTKAQAAAQAILNLVMSANPIGAIIAAVGALIAIVVLLVSNWEKVAGFFKDTWNKITGFFTGGNKEIEASNEKAVKSIEKVENKFDEYSGSLDKNGEALESYADIATDMFNRISTESETSVDDMIDNLRENRKAVEDWARNLEVLARRGVDEGLIKYLREEGPAAMAGTAQMLANATGEKLQALSKQYAKNAGAATIDGYSQGITENIDEKMNKTAAWVARAAKNGFNVNLDIHSPSKVFEEIGKFTMEGFINGITSMIDKIKSTMKNIADTVSRSLTSVLGIHSPSTVFSGFGKNTVQGFINGIVSMADAAERAVDSVFGDLGSNIDYGATFDIGDSIGSTIAELQFETDSRMSASPSLGTGARGNGITVSASNQPVVQHISLNVKFDDIDQVYKLTRIFEDFSHNSVVFGGV